MPGPSTHATTPRRGAIALCLALVVIHVVIVSAVVTGAGDHNSTVQRADSACSIYAPNDAVGSNAQRPHHAAYEADSGQAIIDCRVDDNSAIDCRTRDGAA